jgi:hypothetical protein
LQTNEGFPQSHTGKLLYTLVSLSLVTHLHCVICIVSVSTDTTARVSQLSQIHIPAMLLIRHTRILLSNQIRNSSNPSFRRVLYKSGGIVVHHNRKIVNRELDKIRCGQLHQMKNFSFIHRPSPQ